MVEIRKYGNDDYWFAQTEDKNEPVIDGTIMKKRPQNQRMVNSIDVADIDKTSKEIKKAGGKIVLSKSQVPQMGWF